MGVSLVLAGVGSVVLSGAFDDPPEVDLVGRDGPVNVGATDADDIDANNSPTLVRNPRKPGNLAVTNRVDTPFFGCSLHVSFDGGSRWTRTPIPAPEGEEAKCFAPDVAFTGDGLLHIAFVTLKGRGNVPSAAWISTSKDGGRTFSTPARVAGPLAFQVRLAPDPTRPERLYMTWLQGAEVAPLRFTGTNNPIMAIRSDDAGRSWTMPMRVSDGERRRVVTPSPVVGPEGELYVLYLDLGEDRLDYAAGHNGKGGPPYDGDYTLVLTRSVDGGEKWAESPVDSSISAIDRFIVFFPPSPSLAVADDGRVYAAFHDNRLGDPDVWLWSLDPDEDSDWQGPTRVNDTPEKDGTWQYLPKVSVAPSGRVDVLYYDRRQDSENIENQVSLQTSIDHGKTFTPALPLASSPFDSRIGFGAKEGLPDLGSRLGLISDDRFALALWTDTRSGTPATQKQDLASAVVAITEPDRLSGPLESLLRYGGIALILAGLALAALWVVGTPAAPAPTANPKTA
ncbi:MAG: sialidase family protein [Thermoleophilaceae bacterium]